MKCLICKKQITEKGRSVYCSKACRKVVYRSKKDYYVKRCLSTKKLDLQINKVVL